MTGKEIIEALEQLKRDCFKNGSIYNHIELALSLINRQKAQIEALSQKRANIFEISSAYERGRAEAIKEFADRLRKRVSGVGVHNAIDCIVKEMVGEDK